MSHPPGPSSTSAIISRISITANMPFAVLSQGDAPGGGSLEFEEPSGAAVGDQHPGRGGADEDLGPGRLGVDQVGLRGRALRAAPSAP